MPAKITGQLQPALNRSVDAVARLTGHGVMAVTALAMSALALAMLGMLTPWSVVPLTVLGTWLAGRLLPQPTDEIKMSGRVGAALLAIVSVVVAFGLATPHEHFLTSRDSGTYVAIAAWTARTGDLRMAAPSQVFEGSSVEYESLGFPAAGNDPSTLSPQFLHLFPALAGAVGQIGGEVAMYWVNPVLAGLGLLVLFHFAKTILGQWSALLVTAVLAVSMPFLYFSRAPFSETLMFLFVFAGLWRLHQALSLESIAVANTAGVMFGAALLTRIDAAVVLLGLVAYRTLLEFGSANGSESEETRAAHRDGLERTIRIAGVFWILSLAYMFIFSRPYLADHGPLIAVVAGGVIALRLTGDMIQRRGGALQLRGHAIADWSAVLVAAYLTYAGLVRPFVERPHQSDVYGITGLQQGAGVEIDPLRSYAELSVHWLSWYLGPVTVALGLLGAVLLLRRLLLTRIDPLGPFISVGVLTTLLYLFRPSINPDQIWAMRRFVPVVIPSLLLMGAWVWQEHRHRLARAAPLVSVMILAAVAVPLAVVTARGGIDAEFAHSHRSIIEACERLQGSAVLFMGDSATTYQTALQPALRGWCGLEVAAESAERPLGPDELRAMHARATGMGSRLLIVGSEAAKGEEVILFDREFHYLEVALFSAPDSMAALPLRLSAKEWD